eukprot:227708_1
MADSAFTRRGLSRLTKVQLIRKCKMKRLPHNGNKSDMIKRLLNHTKKKSKRTSNNLKHPPIQPSLQSATPTAPKHHHIDKFQLKPNKTVKMRKMRKAKSLDPRALKAMKRFQTYGIGGNCFGELAVNHTNTLVQLTNISKSKSISKAYSGFQFTIYAEAKNKKYWSCGYNSFGELGIGSSDEWLNKPKQITFFKQNKLKIKKLCVNVCGSGAFWITHGNTVYGHGRNDSYQLGVLHKDNVNKPTLIQALTDRNIVDIQSAHSYSIALSSMDGDTMSVIVHSWSRCTIHRDVIQLIGKYTHHNTVYSTARSSYGGNVQERDMTKEFELEHGWKPIALFEDKQIVQIRTGSEHSFFLDGNGEIWGAGDNAFGQLGLGHSDPVETPARIDWFVDGGIVIVDVQCGLYHALALDEDGKIYSWGHAKRGQCGHGMDVIESECLETPRLISYFESNQLIVTQIGCGNYHSFVRTLGGKCYLFGSNHHHQCVVFDERTKLVEPYCINDVVKQKTGGKAIKRVFLGCNNTKITVR